MKPATHSDASSLAPILFSFPSLPPVQTTKTAILKTKILRTRVGDGLDGKGGGGADGGEGGRVLEGRAASGTQALARGVESDPLLSFWAHDPLLSSCRIAASAPRVFQERATGAEGIQSGTRRSPPLLA